MNPPPMTSLLSNWAISSCETRGRPLYLFRKVSPREWRKTRIYIIKSGHFHWKSSCWVCFSRSSSQKHASMGLKCSHVACQHRVVSVFFRTLIMTRFCWTPNQWERQRYLWHFQGTSHYFAVEKARVTFTIQTHNGHRLYCATHPCVDYQTYIGWHFNTLVILVIPYAGTNNKPEPLLSCSLFENRAGAIVNLHLPFLFSYLHTSSNFPLQVNTPLEHTVRVCVWYSCKEIAWQEMMLEVGKVLDTNDDFLPLSVWFRHDFTKKKIIIKKSYLTIILQKESLI